eukprot:1893067-Heterocapsa_arctica.AAC.1
MPDGKTFRFHHGAIDLFTLLDEMWPSLPDVGRFGFPEDLGDRATLESGPCGHAMKPRFMIFDER